MSKINMTKAWKHYLQLSPHIQERDTAVYLKQALDTIDEMRDETEPSEVSSTGLLSGVEVERLFLLAIIHELNTDQVAAVTKYYTEELRPKAKEVLAQFEPERYYKELYFDLLMSVETKIPYESRHDTAKRYIQQAEHRNSGDTGDSDNVEVKNEP